jgi:uncharacterized damage-inducible protein DinB
MDPLIETWRIHHRINLYLLAALTPAQLPTKGASGGRTVAQMFGHIHNVRLMWLKAAGAAPSAVDKLEPEAAHTVASLTKALDASSEAIEALLTTALDNGGKVKGFKPHVHAFVGYLVSHESHHRGQAVLALKASGAPLDKKTAYGLWEWGVR